MLKSQKILKSLELEFLDASILKDSDIWIVTKQSATTFLF